MKPLTIAVLAAVIAGPSFAAPPPMGAPPRAIERTFQPAPTPARPVDKGGPAPAQARRDEHATPTSTPSTRPNDPVLARLSPVYDQCMHKAVSTLDIIDCAGHESERWDARLNRAYQGRMANLNDRQRGALKRAEKAWLAFRDADCAAYEDEDWGTISKIDASQCVLRRTVERALELEAFPADHGPG